MKNPVLTPVILAGVLLSMAAPAQGPLRVDQEPHHKKVFENAALQILEVNIPKGAVTQDHLHSHDIAAVCIECADTQSRVPGEDWGPLRKRAIGDVTVTEYAGKPGVHAVRTVGAGSYRLVAVESLRLRDWSAGKAVAAPATRLSQETRAYRTYDVRLTGNAATTTHIHSVPTVVVLVEGAVTASGDGKSGELKQSGQWLVLSPGQPHALSAAGAANAHLVEIEVR